MEIKESNVISLSPELQKIKKLAIIALFSDDDLMENFVLKGGNALNIAYGINNRASIDIDVSMEDDFKEEEMSKIQKKLEKALMRTFKEEGYLIFDIKFEKRPLNIKDETNRFWGGYRLEFKIISFDLLDKVGNDKNNLRKNSIVTGLSQKRIFKIDISKYEYCKPKKEVELDGYIIYVYTPVMVIYEKLRAICQQMEEYGDIIHTHRRPRARDFFDIYSILEGWQAKVDIYSPENIEILKQIFAIKKVPLYFLGKIETQREYHRADFDEVKNSVTSESKIENFDFYFDYVVSKVNALKSFWEK